MVKEEVIKKDLRECLVGDVLAEDITNMRTGTVLCSKDYKMTEQTINWLAKFRHSDIYIKKAVPQETKAYERQVLLDNTWKVEARVATTYKQTTKKLQSVFESVNHNGDVIDNKFTEIKEKFFENFNANYQIMGCVNKIKEAHEYTYTHCMNVGMLAVLIGKWLGISEEGQRSLFLAGMLHDIGKYKLDQELLNKVEPLTEIEFEELKKHAVYSYAVIKDMKNIDYAVKEAVFQHHERIDGSGYPMALKGNDISLFARILAIADVYDAMTSNKIYKQRKTPFEAMEILIKEGMEQLDRKILMTFLSNIADYYIGVHVRLSNDKKGEVVFINQHCIYRPIVKVEDQFIDLLKEPHIKIVEIVA